MKEEYRTGKNKIVHIRERVEIMIEIKFLFGDWKEATKEEAEKFYRTFQEGSAAIKTEDKQEYFNKHHIRGGHVLSTGKVETVEEQEERVFNHYKKENNKRKGRKTMKLSEFIEEDIYKNAGIVEYITNGSELDQEEEKLMNWTISRL